MTDRLSEETPVIARLAETAAAGFRRRRGERAGRAFLDVVNVVKGCREKPEKAFRNLSE
jgi:hypothetical protein